MASRCRKPVLTTNGPENHTFLAPKLKVLHILLELSKYSRSTILSRASLTDLHNRIKHVYILTTHGYTYTSCGCVYIYILHMYIHIFYDGYTYTYIYIIYYTRIICTHYMLCHVPSHRKKDGSMAGLWRTSERQVTPVEKVWLPLLFLQSSAEEQPKSASGFFCGPS